jgi:hypothetical protein
MRRADRQRDSAHVVSQQTKRSVVLPEVTLPAELTRDRLDRRCSIRPIPHWAQTGFTTDVITTDVIAIIDARLDSRTTCSIHHTATRPHPIAQRCAGPRFSGGTRFEVSRVPLSSTSGEPRSSGSRPGHHLSGNFHSLSVLS